MLQRRTASTQRYSSRRMLKKLARIPPHWRLLFALQLGISGAIGLYRYRVIEAKRQIAAEEDTR